MVIVGGSGYFFGPFLGALVSVLLPEWLRFAGGYYLILYALAVMVLMAFCPQGLLGLVERFLHPVSKGSNALTPDAAAPEGETDR